MTLREQAQAAAQHLKAASEALGRIFENMTKDAAERELQAAMDQIEVAQKVIYDAIDEVKDPYRDESLRPGLNKASQHV